MKTLAILAATTLLTSCGTKHPGTYEVPEASVPTDMATAMKDHADTLWEMRDDKEKLKESLSKYEAAYNADPTSREVAYKLTRGYYLAGDIHETVDEQKLAAWEVSISWGKKCLALNSEFTAMLEKGDETEATAVRVTTKDDVPCLYWMATSLGKWAKLSGLSKTLKHLPTVKAYIARVAELEPNYFYSAPDRYWGAYYAAIPSFAGQDLDKSKEYFDKSIAANPEYLGTTVLLAEYWAVRTQDQDAFDKAIQFVLDADAEAEPAIAPENRAEKKKAEELKAKKSELFAE